MCRCVCIVRDCVCNDRKMLGCMFEYIMHVQYTCTVYSGSLQNSFNVHIFVVAETIVLYWHLLIWIVFLNQMVRILITLSEKDDKPKA